MKWIVVLCTVLSILLGLNACDRSSAQSPPASSPGQEKSAATFSFNPGTAKLADIPPGYEMSDVFFSRDGRSVAVILRKDGKAFFSINGRISAPYEDVRDLIFRNGHGGYAFAASKNGKVCVIVDGKEGALYDGMDKPIFAPDGRVVYQASRNEKWHVVSGTQESVPLDEFSPVLVVSNDGKISYVERNITTKKSRLRVCDMDLSNCAKGKEYDFIPSSESNSSLSHLAYVVSKGGKMSVVTADLRKPGLAEKEVPQYDRVLSVGLSPGGEHSAFLVRRGKNTLLVKDGIESPAPAFDMSLDVVVAENGRIFCSGAVKDKVIALVDGKQIDKGYREIYSPTFSAGGDHFAFAAGIDPVNFIVVDGAAGPEFDKVVNPHFSPDGSRIVYRARRKGERFVVVADLRGRTLREFPPYEAIWDANFYPDGKSVGYGVRKGPELWWIVEDLNK
jgi:hypothetical protein